MKLSNRNRTLGLAIKLLIAVLSGWYIYTHFSTHPAMHGIMQGITTGMDEHYTLFILVLVLMPVNWMLESFKWKMLASRVQPVSFYKAMQGVLAGVTIGTATPNRIGEFAGRIYSVESDQKKDLLLLSFVASLCQVMVTVLVAAVFFLTTNSNMDMKSALFVIGVLTVLLIPAYPLITGKLPVRWRTKLAALNGFPSTLFFRIFFLSLLRYSVYVTQFFLLLKMAAPEIGVISTIGSISIAYFIITMIPTFSITEILVRGSVAGLFIGNDDRLSDLAFYSSALLWTINVAVPSLIGIYFLFRLKFFSKE